MPHLPGRLFAATLFILPLSALAQNEAGQCADLSQLELDQVISLSAELDNSGQFQAPGSQRETPVAPFCRVSLTVEPAVQIEVWLPSPREWNGRYLAVGGGGLAGVISYNAMIPAINDNYVTSSTDTGHRAGESDWLSDPQRMRDYGYRAIHQMALKTKALIQAYYGRPQDYAYFNGCSTGGRQGLMEAQRFPEDFNGIASGAPVNYFTATHYTQLWISEAAKPRAETLLPVETLSLVTRKVMAQCDALDGVEDGVLEDPRQCDFEPASLRCGFNETEQCLSDPQVSALEKIYQGPVHGTTGAPLHHSLMPGGESPAGYEGNWILVGGRGVFDIPRLFFANAVFEDPDWDWRQFNFGGDIQRSLRRTGAMLEATNPNLDPFRAQGGKLIMYHGWNDQVIFPESTIAYYDSIIANLPMSGPGQAAEDTADFARLFMVPGMSHCGGGPGTDTFDMQAHLQAWVEDSRAPDLIPATHMNDGQITRRRPLCPYPQTARHDGSGNPDEMSSFSCAASP